MNSGARFRYVMIIGGAVVLAAAAAVMIMGLLTPAKPGAQPRPSGTSTAAPGPRPTGQPPSTSPVDPSTAPPEAEGQFELTPEGWIVAPTTTDPEVFGTAMLEAVATFDSTTSDQGNWQNYLGGWLQNSPLDLERKDETQQQQVLSLRRQELTRDVMLQPEFWGNLEKQSGQLSATISDVSMAAAPAPFFDEWDVTGTLTFHYTTHENGVEQSWTEPAGTLMVRVACTTSESGEKLPCVATRWFGPM